MEFHLASVGALSVRRDNALGGRAGCALGVHIFDLFSSRVSHPLSKLDASLNGYISLSQSVSLSESLAVLTFSSFPFQL